MWFTFVALIGMVIGRKIGWLFSRAFLYPAPIVLSVLGAIVWGTVIGIGISSLIGALHPHAILKWVFGFALGSYVAIPNYGLFRGRTIPDPAQPRHVMISQLPLVAYIVTEFATRFMR